MQQSNVGSEMSQTNQTESQSDGVGLTQRYEKLPRDNRFQQNKESVNDKPKDGKEDKREPLSLAELFRSENPDDPEDDSFSVEDEEDLTKPADSIDGVAKRLKMKVEDVYKIKVPMPSGAEPMTLGDLKDRVGELVDLDLREMEFNTRRIRGEGELLRSQQELRSLMALIPKDKLTPELINKVRKTHEATQARERQLTIEHIPSWMDDKARTADIKGMIEMLGDYGFDESFIETIVDHRALKFVRDMYLMRRRIQSALKNVKIPVRKGNKAPSHKPNKAAAKPADDRTSRPARNGREKLAELFKGD